MVVNSEFSFSSRSLAALSGVHPDLVRVVKRAIELSNTDFGVSEGVRTWARQQILLYEGKSTTENSQHLLQDTGYGHAVDVFAYIDGKANWSNIVYGPIVQAFITAAIEEEVQVQFGHLWPNFQDSVHVQLNPAYY